MAIKDGKIKCSTCQIWKELESFQPAMQKRGSGICKPCKHKEKKRYYYKYHEKSLKAAKDYRIKKGKAWKKAISRRTYDKHGQKYALKQNYGLTLERYFEILQKQNHQCAICGTTKNTDGKKLYIDHCHETKKIRGILCRKCNTGIGLLGDTAEAIRKAYEYMIKSENNLGGI
jgi:hypothetical protein